MSLYYSCGELCNLLARGTVTCNPAELATSPLTALYDGKPSPFTFGSNAADSYVQLRNNLLANPSFETALTISGWIDADTGAGVSDQGAAGSGRAGGATKCLECDGNGDTSARCQSKTVRAGERLRADGWIKPGLTFTGNIRVYCEETAQWCVTAAGAGGVGSWQTAAGDLVLVTNQAGWTRVAETTFQMPTLATALWPTLTLRFYCYTASNATVSFDDVALIPAVNGASVHGHNLHACTTPTLRYSDDAFAADDNVAATFTIARPSFYAHIGTAVYREYWRIKIGGTNTAAPYMSEAWMGYFETKARRQEFGWPVKYRPVTTLAGDDTSAYLRYRQGSDMSRSVKLDFRSFDDSDWKELVRDIYQRTYGGDGAIVLVPSSDSTEAPVIYGKIDPIPLELTRVDETVRSASISVSEMAFPSIGA